jgi:hypothetical protein
VKVFYHVNILNSIIFRSLTIFDLLFEEAKFARTKFCRRQRWLWGGRARTTPAPLGFSNVARKRRGNPP